MCLRSYFWFGHQGSLVHYHFWLDNEFLRNSDKQMKYYNQLIHISRKYIQHKYYPYWFPLIDFGFEYPTPIERVGEVSRLSKLLWTLQNNTITDGKKQSMEAMAVPCLKMDIKGMLYTPRESLYALNANPTINTCIKEVSIA